MAREREFSQPEERLGHLGVALAEGLLAEGEGALQVAFPRLVLAKAHERAAKAPERNGEEGMFPTLALLADGDSKAPAPASVGARRQTSPRMLVHAAA